MLTFSDGKTIPKWFGDFGGNFCLNDTDFARLSFPIEEYERAIGTPEFEEIFREILADILPYTPKVLEINAGDCQIRVIPALAKYYAVAGHTALAKLTHAKTLFIGTFDPSMARSVAKAGALLHISVQVALGRKLSRDEALIGELKALGADVDSSTVFTGFDLPYGQAEAPFFRDGALYPVPCSANYGIFPKPGLTGMFAGLYGGDLLGLLGDICCCTVPTDTGLEALGVFKALQHTSAKLCTCEETVASEYHGCDTGTYTLVKKYADQTGESTSVCPELAAMWRSGRVMRLGCDRVMAVNSEPFRQAGLSAAAARTAALTAERFRNFVLLEKEGMLW